MRKAGLFFIILLGGIFAVLTWVDKGDYVLERHLWNLQKDYREIALDPSVVPDGHYEKLALQYVQLVNRFPESRLVPQIYSQIGDLYVLKKDYTSARQYFQRVIDQFSDSDQLSARAVFKIAKTYEQENRSDEAIDHYKRIFETYPWTRVGLNIPVYLVEYNLRRGDHAAAANALEDAVLIYQQLSDDQEGNPVGLKATTFLINTYSAQQKWGEVFKTLSDTLLIYGGQPHLTDSQARKIVAEMNNIALFYLKDYDLPLNVYRAFLDKYKGHRFQSWLRMHIIALEYLRQRSGAGGQDDD